MNETVNIRAIQHFMYCKRRWGLLEINGDWAENAFVVKADIMHEHVHDGSHNFSDKNKIVRSSEAVYNDSEEYDLYGIADCVEFVKDNNGVEIKGLKGLYSVKLVEYKPKAPDGCGYRETDAIQVFAQKICADFVWGCKSEGYIYYSDIRKRIKLPFDDAAEYEKYDKKLKELLYGMRRFLTENKIPEREKGQKCSGCSMKELCFSKTSEYSVKSEIERMRKEDCI